MITYKVRMSFLFFPLLPIKLSDPSRRGGEATNKTSTKKPIMVTGHSTKYLLISVSLSYLSSEIRNSC